MTMTATLTPTPRPTVPPPTTPTAAVCGACKGEGGAWVTNDGKSAGKNISRWVACTACKGKGTK
jgi:DNA-directed RNA polymerase subunit M/transcription elongation factor TFIIS